MGELKVQDGQRNVNVTLADADALLGDLAGSEFPCPLCKAYLPILASKRKKPYVICNSCGLQLFFRGKSGILRLKEMAISGILVSVKKPPSMPVFILLSRLEQLRLQKHELERKQGIFFPDTSLGNAIRVVDGEIQKIESELAKMAGDKEEDKKK